MAMMLSSVMVLALGGFIGFGLAGPEQGRWVFDVDNSDVKEKGKTYFFYKSMFNNSQIGLTIICDGSDLVPITFDWMVRQTPCANEYLGVNEALAELYLNTPALKLNDPMPYKTVRFYKGVMTINCTKQQHQILHPFVEGPPQTASYEVAAPKVKNQPNENEQSSDNEEPNKSSLGQGLRKLSPGQEPVKIKRQIEGTAQKLIPERRRRSINDTELTADTKEQKEKTQEKVHEQNDKLVQVWDDGYYLFILHFRQPAVPNEFKMKVIVTMSYGNRFLSAVDWPLLIFYGVMGLIYIFYGIFWLVMLACNWRDLLRVQFWIGAVIFLGMLEKAVFFGEYENINNTGESVRGAIIVAELVSCLKRTLARMLVLIVSLGYGIVKPRLGQTFHKVLFVGVVFFILASIESCSRALSGRADQSMKLLVASIPLAVTDAIICWWIFSSLLQTTRTLRLRRNVVKLSLYRHFTNTLIFSVIASVAYMIWFMTQHRLKECITDWKELWIDDAFWHLLFSVILFVIMILWRPSANNQRYAFSPLLDAAEDDLDDEQALSDAYEGMKMRTTSSQQRNGTTRGKEDQKEDDLKWVEDNIPSSLADRVLPALDSDEEIMNTKFEVSKME